MERKAGTAAQWSAHKKFSRLLHGCNVLLRSSLPRARRWGESSR